MEILDFKLISNPGWSEVKLDSENGGKLLSFFDSYLSFLSLNLYI